MELPEYLVKVAALGGGQPAQVGAGPIRPAGLRPLIDVLMVAMAVTSGRWTLSGRPPRLDRSSPGGEPT